MDCFCGKRLCSLEVQHDFLAVETSADVGCFGYANFPDQRPLRIDRLMLDRHWGQDVLVTLRIGKRALERIPASRFHEGLRLGWTADVGNLIELFFINIGTERAVVRGCIDYTTTVVEAHGRSAGTP